MTDERQRRIFAQNLRFYIANSGKQQKTIAQELGFNYKTMSGWCNALSMPTMGKVQALADYFGIRKSDLLDMRTEAPKRTDAIRIPVYFRVAAGIPIEASEEIIDYEEISVAMAKTGDYFGIRVKGVSMEPKISDGDTVIVRKQTDAENGELVIVTVNGHDATLKKLKKIKDGVMLISLNPAFEPIVYSAKEVQSLPVQIIGKAVELRARL